MTREEVKKMLPVLQAFAEGKTIESRWINGDKSLWYDDEDPSFDNDLEYRIKQESKYRQFANAEECWQEMLNHQPFGYTYDRFNGIRDCITKVATTGVAYDSPTVISFEEVFDKFVFADGVPFGIKVE